MTLATASKPVSLVSSLSFLWSHRWFTLVALVIIAFGGYEGVRIIYGPEAVVDKVERADLVQTLVASGHVQRPFRVEIGSQITGIVADVLVQEGQHVTKDQTLIVLDERELKTSVLQNEAAVAQSEARVRQLANLTLPAAQEALDQARANLVFAQNSYNRVVALSKNDFATQATLDENLKNLNVAKAQVRGAELQVATASPGGSDFVLADSQLRQAKANLDTAQARLAYARITAPRDGTLISRSVEKGTVVQAGRTLLVLAPSGASQLVLQVDERNLSSIALGQKALAAADAYPDQKFEASPAYINPGIDIARASVEVKLDVPSPPAVLREDMTVSVDIEVARAKNTLVLSTRSVHDALSNKPWVLQVKDGRAVVQQVKLGLRGATKTEILEGLIEGDLVLPATSGLSNGQRVRPVTP